MHMGGNAYIIYPEIIYFKKITKFVIIMAITYTWTIVNLEAKASHDNHENVIFNVHWRLDGI